MRFRPCERSALRGPPPPQAGRQLQLLGAARGWLPSIEGTGGRKPPNKLHVLPRHPTSSGDFPSRVSERRPQVLTGAPETSCLAGFDRLPLEEAEKHIVVNGSRAVAHQPFPS